jgi:hypothetical protein
MLRCVSPSSFSFLLFLAVSSQTYFELFVPSLFASPCFATSRLHACLGLCFPPFLGSISKFVLPPPLYAAASIFLAMIFSSHSGERLLM